MKCLAILALVFLAIGRASAQAEKILFIRGGAGTVGFFEGGADEQGADVFNYATNSGNHGWGELNAALVAEGFTIDQMAESPVVDGVPAPVPLDTLDLTQYAVIVFGSNNAEYTTVQVDALMTFIGDGGSALFVSDANFGQNWGDAPSSDQHFLDRFGLTMNQDTGTYGVRRANEFVEEMHPILNGVDEFDGEGVSPITRNAPPTGVTSSIVTLARNQVRRNTGAAQGPTEAVTSEDASLVVATFGSGRIAGHYDRNTFFNDNGAGTNLNRFDNEVYTRNLFNWLAGKSTVTSNYAPRGHFPTLLPGSTLVGGAAFTTEIVAKDPDGSVASVSLEIDGMIAGSDTTAPYQLQVPALAPGTRMITASIVDNLGATTEVAIEVEVIDSSDIELPLDRGGWILSGTNNTEELGSAIDGDLGTRWTTREFQRLGQKFQIDFGQRELFQRVLLENPSDPNDYPRGFIIRGSDDGVNFTDLIVGTGVSTPTDILLPEPVTYQFLEIEQTGSSSANWWSIHEINVFRPAENTVLPLTSWLQFHFGTVSPDLLADDDGDGLITLAEYAFNSNPFDASSSEFPTVAGGVAPSDGAPYLDYTFRRWSDESVSDVAYVIEAGDDLASWDSDELDLTFMGEPVSNGDGTETVTARIQFGLTEAKNFVRLRLIQE